LGDYASSCGSWSLYSATGTIPMALSEAIIATYITIHVLIESNFLGSRPPLHTGHAVAALLVLEDGRYIMQLRDDIPNIWYPGHWGLFGGNIDDEEEEVAALRRHLREELELDVNNARLFAIINYDLQPIGLDCYFRRCYEVPVTIAAWKRIVLHEGSDVRALTG
jgi:8-oxo-dGTP pyrophosphatase MutT (NUDIX family)